MHLISSAKATPVSYCQIAHKRDKQYNCSYFGGFDHLDEIIKLTNLTIKVEYPIQTVIIILIGILTNKLTKSYVGFKIVLT